MLFVQEILLAMPKISVIIPIYNTQKWLSVCLDSVIGQSVKELEIICVDDGSTDDSAKILQEYAKKDSRIKIITQSNQGPAIARNTGLTTAKGEYVYFLDSDDYLVNDTALEFLYELSSDQKLDILFFDRIFAVPPEQSDKIDCTKKSRKKEYPEVVDGLTMFEQMFWNRDYRGVLWLQFFNRNFLKTAGLTFCPGAHSEDDLFCLQAILFAQRCRSTQNQLIAYRLYREGSIMAQARKNREYLQGRLIGLREILKLGQEKSLISNYRITDAINIILNNHKDYIYSLYESLPESERQKIKTPSAVEREILNECIRRPSVSVIIPVYNTEQYLPQCLDSVIKQSMELLEIICVNDGSTDNSEQILQKYAAQDSRIKVISQKNQGQSVARNTGLFASRGEYIYFLNSDDFLLEEAVLPDLYDFSKQKGLDILYFEAKPILPLDPADEFWRVRSKEYSAVISGPELFYQMNTNQDYRTASWLQFFRGNFLKKNSLKFYPRVCGEDNMFSLKSILLAQKTAHWKKQLIASRANREDSHMSRYYFKAQGLRDLLIFLREINIFLQKKPLPPPVLMMTESILRDYADYARKAYYRLPLEERLKIKKFSEKERKTFLEILPDEKAVVFPE